jgi:ADP-ribose pyrophosphatase YjhB (NUDIX family)
MAPRGEERETGVGVIVVRGGDVLFGLRRGAHGGGSWSLPGGHLDGGESVETCALRELSEEAGVEAINPRVVADTEDRTSCCCAVSESWRLSRGVALPDAVRPGRLGRRRADRP